MLALSAGERSFLFGNQVLNPLNGFLDIDMIYGHPVSLCFLDEPL